MIIEGKEEERTGTAAITDTARVTKRKRTCGEIPEEKRRRKTRRRDRKMYRRRREGWGGWMGKMCEEGNKEKRSKRVGSWLCGYDRRNEREKEGEGGN